MMSGTDSERVVHFSTTAAAAATERRSLSRRQTLRSSLLVAAGKCCRRTPRVGRIAGQVPGRANSTCGSYIILSCCEFIRFPPPHFLVQWNSFTWLRLHFPPPPSNGVGMGSLQVALGIMSLVHETLKLHFSFRSVGICPLPTRQVQCCFHEWVLCIEPVAADAMHSPFLGRESNFQ